MTSAPLPDLLSLAVQVAMGLGLAACAGLRAFLPLLVVGLAGRLELVPLSESFAWLATGPALVVLSVAVVAELLADKVPVVDHALDALGTLVKPVAGTLLAASVLTDLPPLPTAVLALCTGGAVSAGVHLTKAKVRLLSTAATAGIGNPLLSVLEDVGAVIGSVAALVVPLLVAALFLAALVGLLVLLAARRARAHSLP
jgi:uncharacterized protein DUF4126